MAFPYQQMKDPQAAKAEPDLPSDTAAQPQTVVLPVVASSYPVMGQSYQPQCAPPTMGQPLAQPGAPVMATPYPGAPAMGQPYQPQPGTPTMGQPYQPQPGTPTMGQGYQPQPGTPTMAQQQYQMGAMAYPAQPGAPYSQPYQQPYAQPAPMYAQPVMQPGVQVQALASITCVICHVQVVGIYYRCVGCKNNGRPGGYHICPNCHSRQKVKEKGLFDEFTQELGQLTYNSTSERPHERWHPYEQVNPLAQAQPVYVVPAQMPAQPYAQQYMAQPVVAVTTPPRIQFIISCKELMKQGFGFVLPDPSVSVSINGKEIAHTEQQNQCCNPHFQRPVDVSNAEAKVTFTVYSAGTRHGCISTQMSEILRAPNQTWTKAFEDPRTGYRLQSGVLVVKWVAAQAPASVVQQPSFAQVAQPAFAQGPGVQAPYAQAPQYFAPPTYVAK